MTGYPIDPRTRSLDPDRACRLPDAGQRGDHHPQRGNVVRDPAGRDPAADVREVVPRPLVEHGETVAVRDHRPHRLVVTGLVRDLRLEPRRRQQLKEVVTAVRQIEQDQFLPRQVAQEDPVRPASGWPAGSRT